MEIVSSGSSRNCNPDIRILIAMQKKNSDLVVVVVTGRGGGSASSLVDQYVIRYKKLQQHERYRMTNE
jgi:hypothetical protein